MKTVELGSIDINCGTSMFPSPKLNLFICEIFIDGGRKIRLIKAYLSVF